MEREKERRDAFVFYGPGVKTSCVRHEFELSIFAILHYVFPVSLVFLPSQLLPFPSLKSSSLERKQENPSLRISFRNKINWTFFLLVLSVLLPYVDEEA